MTVLSRYLFREFLRGRGACILGFLLLFLLIDFVEHAEKLLRHNADLREIGWYYLTRVPGIFVLISPVGTMLAVLVAVSLRVRSNELTAIFSSGMSLLRVCVPILAGCALVSALSLLCSEVLAPAANRYAREIERLRRAAGNGGGAILGEPVLDARRAGDPLRPVGGRSFPFSAGIPVHRGGPGFSPAAQNRIPQGPPPSR